MNLGGKANNLITLTDSLGIKTASFVVIPHSVIAENDVEYIQTKINALDPSKKYAVRSSGSAEDGENQSFAGQFLSILNCETDEIENAIKKVVDSAKKVHVTTYANTAISIEMNVIVQEMVQATSSGVLFTANPVNGKKEIIINAVNGLAEDLVSGKVNADTYVVKNTKIEHRNALNSPLTEEQIQQLLITTNKIELAYKNPQDIEFAFENDALFILQTRPITTIKKRENRQVWDNSNIVESYPGVTTPLTFSFISQSYKTAYRQMGVYLGIDTKDLNANEPIFVNTLGLLNGRVYYNLRSWYLMLALLPGYKLNATFMEKMMGVKERFEVPAPTHTSKVKLYLKLSKTLFQLLNKYKKLDKTKALFYQKLNSTMQQAQAVELEKLNASEIIAHFNWFESELILEWKAPLLNDLFAMIFYGRFEKKCKALLPQHQNLHNELLCGSKDIVSIEPVHLSLDLVAAIQADEHTLALFKSESSATIWQNLEKTNTSIYQQFIAYINKFGERCLGELKLETISYAQNPLQFVGIIQGYIKQNINKESFAFGKDDAIREEAEAKLNDLSWWKRRKLKKTLKTTRKLIRDRENLRFERTRAFGEVRRTFTALGKQWKLDGVLEDERLVFYLTRDEIIAYKEGRSVTQNINALAKLRKEEFEAFKAGETLPERIETLGVTYQNKFESYYEEPLEDADIFGIGCSSGIVEAEVIVVENPQEVVSIEGKIMVAKSTDPGWISLFPTCSGMLVERGSLLSHSAIVCREMGIPCIVAIEGITKKLKTGTRVKMNGKTGEIVILSEHE